MIIPDVTSEIQLKNRLTLLEAYNSGELVVPEGQSLSALRAEITIVKEMLEMFQSNEGK